MTAFILSAARTSVVPFGGVFKDLQIEHLAIPPIQQCLRDSGLSVERVEEIVTSNALGGGGNPARIIALAAGCRDTVAGLSIDRQCAGGLDAILLARDMIKSGRFDVVLAGGAESHSLRPRRYYKNSCNADYVLREQARFTPWPDRDPDMHEAANALAEKYTISRQLQDAWAITSHAKAMTLQEYMEKEIANPDGISLSCDPFARDLTQALCDRAKILSGSVTGANTSPAADGAAFVLVVSEKILKDLKPSYALEIMDGITCGSDPTLPGLAPVKAINTVFDQTGVTAQDMNAIELMEAYAVQAILCAEHAGLPIDRINQCGGSIARGHPIGASGTILAVRLFHDLQRTQGQYGLAAIASAGGIGTAALFKCR